MSDKKSFRLSDHPLVVIIGLIASGIAIYALLSGNESIGEIIGDVAPQSSAAYV